MEWRVGGRRVFASTGGRVIDPALPTVIFVHGAACDHSVWALVARYFAHRGRNALAIDLPGHGRSEGPALDRVGAMADWVLEASGALSLPAAAWVGHSLGGLIALDAAARHPGRVRALCLISVAAPMQVNDEYLSLAAAGDPKAIELMNDWAVSRQSHVGGNRMPGVWLIGSNTRLTEKGAAVLAADLRAVRAYGDGGQAAAKVRCPALLLLGTSDQMTPFRQTESLARAIPGARVAALKNCGHWPMGERPDEVIDNLATLV
jgi:pimeloyl-ACP methyl ester carboxylesterase